MIYIKGKQILDNTITQKKLLLSTPINTNDAATKAYTDGLALIPYQSQAWNGSNFNIDFTTNSVKRLIMNQGVSTITFSLVFPTDATTFSKNTVIEIDNSNNTVAIASIVFNDNSGTYKWRWGVGIKPSGMAASSIAYLYLVTIGDTIIKASWEVIE